MNNTPLVENTMTMIIEEALSLIREMMGEEDEIYCAYPNGRYVEAGPRKPDHQSVSDVRVMVDPEKEQLKYKDEKLPALSKLVQGALCEVSGYVEIQPKIERKAVSSGIILMILGKMRERRGECGSYHTVCRREYVDVIHGEVGSPMSETLLTVRPKFPGVEVIHGHDWEHVLSENELIFLSGVVETIILPDKPPEDQDITEEDKDWSKASAEERKDHLNELAGDDPERIKFLKLFPGTAWGPVSNRPGMWYLKASNVNAHIILDADKWRTSVWYCGGKSGSPINAKHEYDPTQYKGPEPNWVCIGPGRELAVSEYLARELSLICARNGLL